MGATDWYSIRHSSCRSFGVGKINFELKRRRHGFLVLHSTYWSFKSFSRRDTWIHA